MDCIEKCKNALNLVFNDENKIVINENTVYYLKKWGNVSLDNEPQGVICIITDKNIIVQSLADYSKLGYEKIKITLPLDCNNSALYAAINYCLNETEYFLKNVCIYGTGFTCYDFNNKLIESELK